MILYKDDLNCLKKPLIKILKKQMDLTIEDLEFDLNKFIYLKGIIRYKGIQAKISTIIEINVNNNEIVITFKEGNLVNSFLNVDFFDFIKTMIKPQEWFYFSVKSIVLKQQYLSMNINVNSIKLCENYINIDFCSY